MKKSVFILMIFVAFCGSVKSHSSATMSSVLSKLSDDSSNADEKGDSNKSIENDFDKKFKKFILLLLKDKHPEATGTPANGKLINGILLPESGPGYVTFKPYRYGTAELIYVILMGIREVLIKYPATVPVVIGDLSRRGGGYLSPHVSHQNGLDVDVGYYHTNNKPYNYFFSYNGKNIDFEKTLTFIEGVLKTGMVKYIFIDYAIQKQLYFEAQKRGWGEKLLERVFQFPKGKWYKKTIIRHVKGHKTHFHIRVLKNEEFAY